MYDVLPSQGWICVGKLLSNGKFRNKFFETIEEADRYLSDEDARGETVYLAQAGFKTDENRRQDNVLSVRSFWLDIDCGDGKPYPGQKEGFAALKVFCEAIGLPMPSIVNSGNGLYAHWILTDDISPGQWKAAAEMLKGLYDAHGFFADDSRTSDSSSVLRPVGTHNRKDPGNPKPVKLLRRAADIEFDSFLSVLEAAAKKAGVSVAPLKAPKLNQEFIVEAAYTGPPSDPQKIKEKCQQIAHIADRQEKVEEPLWYAMIGLVRHCLNGRETIHEWSCGHPEYDSRVTDSKIDQHEKADIGPTTCHTFAKLNHTGCIGCEHKDKITSPVQLGKTFVPADPSIEIREEKPELPAGFQLTQNGLVLVGEEPILFYDQELYVTDLAWDESLGYETATIKHYLPFEGWNTFKIRSSLTNDSKNFNIAMADNHIKIVGGERKKAMLMYVESYMQKLQRQRKMAQLVCQMGWKEDGRFVLGHNVIMADGSVEPVSLAKSVPVSIEALHTQGELAPWVEATEIFNGRGMEPLAFAFCAGAFGAPLMKFTGYPGAMVSMLGPSGVGKTLTGTWLLSTYGKPDRLIMLKDDTKNALINRLGAYGNLPLYIDEITNIDATELSELTYRITQGRDKQRLTRAAVERSVNNHWQTLAVVSSNASIVDKLSNLKQDASPELNRVLEYSVRETPHLNREVATKVYRTITENYGHAGVEYVKYLTANQEKHRERIDQMIAIVDKKTRAMNEERYWSAIAGVTLYGAIIAKKIGIIKFDPMKMLEWVVEAIVSMRDTKFDSKSSAFDILGQFLDEYAHCKLVVNERGVEVITPRGPLVYRVEPSSDLLMLSRAKMREFCMRTHGSYTAAKQELANAGALVEAGKRKVLGSGTAWAGASQPCWIVSLKHPAMGKYNLQLAEEMIVNNKKAR